MNLGNVNEVFIDLCRQMLRKDDLSDDMHNEENDKLDVVSRIGRRKNRRKGESGRSRCVIL